MALFLFRPQFARHAWYDAEVSPTEVHAAIGANFLAGFTPLNFTVDSKGERLRTPDGDPLTVVALVGPLTQRVTVVVALTETS
ncbi:hypothetical protein [Streptomyces sp. NPDC088557]|uniref:hypothetical protein n=1 Tax=Streptomyces sp. NPDC088557 TaxID=3365867 RepID=UPI00382E04C1